MTEDENKNISFMIELNYTIDYKFRISGNSYTVESYIIRHRQLGKCESTIKFNLGKILKTTPEKVRELFDQLETKQFPIKKEIKKQTTKGTWIK